MASSYPRPSESSGIELTDGSNDDVNNNTVAGNTITDSAFAGIKIGGSADGNTLSDNTITGTLHGGASGSSGSTSGGGGTAILLTGFGATNTTITGNTLENNSGYGILQEGTEGSSIDNVAHQNSITDNGSLNDGLPTGGGVLNNDAALFIATQNWWGAADGPSGQGPGSGQSVSANVTFDPWLTCPPGTGPCTNQAPTAAFSATPSSTPGSLQVAVDGSNSADPDGTIVSYAWDFGDEHQRDRRNRKPHLHVGRHLHDHADRHRQQRRNRHRHTPSHRSRRRSRPAAHGCLLGYAVEHAGLAAGRRRRQQLGRPRRDDRLLRLGLRRRAQRRPAQPQATPTRRPAPTRSR